MLKHPLSPISSATAEAKETNEVITRYFKYMLKKIILESLLSDSVTMTKYTKGK